jgi:hypothetical protein
MFYGSNKVSEENHQAQRSLPVLSIRLCTVLDLARLFGGLFTDQSEGRGLSCYYNTYFLQKAEAYLAITIRTSYSIN